MPEKPQDTKKKKKVATPEDDVLGKAYDGRLMRRLLTYLRPYKAATALSAVAILLKACSDVMGPFLIKVAVDNYMSAQRPANPSWLARHLSTTPLTGVAECAALFLGSLSLSYGLEFVQTYLMQWTGQRIMFDLRKQIFRHLQRMDVAFFDHNPVGRLVTRVTSDVDALNEMFTSGVLAIFEDVFVLLFIVIIMLKMSWPLAILTLSVLPLIMYATRLFRISVRESYRRIRTAIAQINSFTQEHVSGMSVVQLFNREQRAYNDFKDINAAHRDAFVDQVQAYSLYYPAVELLSSIAIALVVWRGGHAIFHETQILGGTVTLGVLIAFMQYAQRFFRPIQDLSEKYNILQAAMAASERVFKLIDTPAQITSPALPVAGDLSGSIEFRNVWFTYQRLDEATAARLASATESELAHEHGIEWILRNVSFTVAPDQTAAIVGHTGAGKTTITGLMMRFYDIQHGSILIDGVDVRQQDLNKLRKRFGVVLQDSTLFTGTVADNIRLGTTSITDEEVEHAADEVNIGDFIRTLPLQFAEPMHERGATLSTGQKQLISFARALAHRPAVLILDEATSSVDTETELRVRLALDRMITGRTSIVIAHRLSTIQRADTILVMHKGQLRESGTHNQLLAARGLYWKLYQLQYQEQEAEPTEPITAQIA
ncbi:ABC transporter ATP-binding protein [Terriglobus saanensis]|uniref:ABC transporter related protein n=1 Tax=Terriglobus saanensis (strain ATCC BAA-1853 / DSM 23119 / SP1PR4) TaxID=401053 RepID=E8UX44_TERSS|nr:ABC transporter ATP-binding protein [Terriglobus saanensis]ADV83007.1 ABC transporter related protein [Terriglobus saanensis SP1PR4]